MIRGFIPVVIGIAIYHYWGDIPLDWIESMFRDIAEELQRSRELRLQPLETVA